MSDRHVPDRRGALPAVALLALCIHGGAVGAAEVAWPTLHFPTSAGFNHTLAVGDLDGDGRLDVATPNSVTSSVSVLLGNGDGTLAPFAAHAVFGDPQDVQMADVTGDGILDLATPDYSGSGITVLRGLGDGGFAPRVAYPAGSGLVSLAAVDLDGDGRRELAVSKEAGHKLAVLPALATGGFGAPVETDSGTLPHQLAAADFDRDGRFDLAVASLGAAAVSVHLGDGTHVPGTAVPFAVGMAPVGLSVADLDLDGDADLVVSDVNAATVSVLLGEGDGTFAAAVGHPTDPRPRGMDAGDLDGDGVPELVVATGYPDGDSALVVYRGVGDGTLAFLARLDLPYRAVDCVIADMNHDGHRDLVATGPFAGVVSVLLNPAGVLDVPRGPAIATGLDLRVHPNPARGAVTFGLRSPAGARLEVFDLSGRRVADLGTVEGGVDRRAFTWRGETASGGRAAPGLYLARLTAGGAAVSRRVVLLDR